MDAAEEIVGRDNVIRAAEPATGSEDLEYVEARKRGILQIGHNGTQPLQPKVHSGLDIIPVGASVLARLVEKRCLRLI